MLTQPLAIKILTLGVLGGLIACSGGRKRPRNAVSVSSSSGPTETFDDSDDDDVSVSGGKRTITFSLSNNTQTSSRLNRKKASSYANQLSKKLKKGKGNRIQFEALVAANALASKNYDQVLRAARRLMSAELAKNVDAKIPANSKLQLALAAVQAGRYPMAEYFMGQISAKGGSVRAAINNIKGILALRSKRIPEAVDFWKKSLKSVPNYKPAKLNLGFVALKYGDGKMAKRMLGSFQNDWFGLYGLVVAERLNANVGAVGQLCTRVLNQKPDYKPALLSCALNKFQGQKKYDDAKKMLKKLVASKNGPSSIDETAYKIMARIDQEKARAKAAAKPKAVAKQPPKGAPAKKTKGGK